MLPVMGPTCKLRRSTRVRQFDPRHSYLRAGRARASRGIGPRPAVPAIWLQPEGKMADQPAATLHPHAGDVTKRDFLQLVTGASAAIGVAAIAWPLIDSMNPSKDVLALSAVEVDLTPVVEGQGIVISWQGKPIFVRHRTA